MSSSVKKGSAISVIWKYEQGNYGIYPTEPLSKWVEMTHDFLQIMESLTETSAIVPTQPPSIDLGSPKPMPKKPAT